MTGTGSPAVSVVHSTSSSSSSSSSSSPSSVSRGCSSMSGHSHGRHDGSRGRVFVEETIMTASASASASASRDTVSAAAASIGGCGGLTTTSTITTTITSTAAPTPTAAPSAVLRQGDTEFRAVHQIKLSALTHNYHCVEAAASNQQCNVIVVVKADGYGHGAIDTAIHLADSVGADAFAVATLEEGIVLRKALDATAAAQSLYHQNGRRNKPVPLARAATSNVLSTAPPTITTTTTTKLHDVNSFSPVLHQQQEPLLAGMKPPKKLPYAHLSTMFQPPESNVADVATTVSVTTTDTSPTIATTTNTAPPPPPTTTTFLSRRSAVIRILVLGPPVGYPRCFDDYYFWGIECMVSGPEVAQALMEWINNPMDRQTRVVERVAQETKMKHLDPDYDVNIISSAGEHAHDAANPTVVVAGMPTTHAMKSATLSGMAGTDLAKEFRQLLQQHQKAKIMPAMTVAGRNTLSSTVSSERSSRAPSPNNNNNHNNSNVTATTTTAATTNVTTMMGVSKNNNPNTIPPPPVAAAVSFGGIEAAALSSRNREKVMTHNPVWIENSTDDFDCADATTTTTTIVIEEDNDGATSTHAHINTNAKTSSLTNDNNDKNYCSSTPSPLSTTPTVANHKKSNSTTINNNNTTNRRRLRWHALVDSGMGRLGFKTDYPQHGERRDTVEILQELVQAQHSHNAPVEFYGMCTHMADANATSTYTHDQISRFKSLLKRVRDVGIMVPTVSTDNSAALLTTTLTHFSPDDLLTQPGWKTRGFVRIGGAIYGQRPAFSQLKSVSTLIAAVRHVAILKEGDSVGYDRAYIAPHNVRIATLTIGFADGYPRDLGNAKGRVAIRNKLYPVAGNVCMDMMMVELGHASEECDVKVGDVAVLWGGDNGVPLKDLAGALNTTQSALTCGLNRTRVAREYV